MPEQRSRTRPDAQHRPGNRHDLEVCLAYLADSHHWPALRRPALVLTCRMFRDYLPEPDPGALTPDEFDLWQTLQFFDVAVPEDRLLTDMEVETFLGILRAHRPISSRLASEVP